MMIDDTTIGILAGILQLGSPWTIDRIELTNTEKSDALPDPQRTAVLVVTLRLAELESHKCAHCGASPAVRAYSLRHLDVWGHPTMLRCNVYECSSHGSIVSLPNHLFPKRDAELPITPTLEAWALAAVDDMGSTATARKLGVPEDIVYRIVRSASHRAIQIDERSRYKVRAERLSAVRGRVGEVKQRQIRKIVKEDNGEATGRVLMAIAHEVEADEMAAQRLVSSWIEKRIEGAPYGIAISCRDEFVDHRQLLVGETTAPRSHAVLIFVSPNDANERADRKRRYYLQDPVERSESGGAWAVVAYFGNPAGVDQDASGDVSFAIEALVLPPNETPEELREVLDADEFEKFKKQHPCAAVARRQVVRILHPGIKVRILDRNGAEVPQVAVPADEAALPKVLGPIQVTWEPVTYGHLQLETRVRGLEHEAGKSRRIKNGQALDLERVPNRADGTVHHIMVRSNARALPAGEYWFCAV